MGLQGREGKGRIRDREESGLQVRKEKDLGRRRGREGR